MADADRWPGTTTLERLCSEMIALRERNDRQHKLFEQTLSQVRDELGTRFSQFVSDIQGAYQRMREDLTGEKRQSLALASMLADLAQDLDRLAAARPSLDGAPPALANWAEGVAVAARKAEAALGQLGIHRFDAHFADEYRPALHERAGGERVEGLSPMRIARQLEPGLASASPDFVVRRAKVIVSE
jgi:molecular chaperone GrpE (heat shock protein)